MGTIVVSGVSDGVLIVGQFLWSGHGWEWWLASVV